MYCVQIGCEILRIEEWTQKLPKGHGTHSLQLRAKFSNNCNIRYSLMTEAREQFTLSGGQDPFETIVILALVLAEWIFQTKTKTEKAKSLGVWLVQIMEIERKILEK